MNNYRKRVPYLADGSTPRCECASGVVYKPQIINSCTSHKAVTISTVADVWSAAPAVVDFRFEVRVCLHSI